MAQIGLFGYCSTFWPEKALFSYCSVLRYILCAILIGISHGFNMTPVTYIIENYQGESKNGKNVFEKMYFAFLCLFIGSLSVRFVFP